jgi:hypothetical protein
MTPANTATGYTGTVRTLADRIKALIPANPSILKMESAWQLFSIPGFECKDLEPSAMQAGMALGIAIQESTK